MKLKKWFKKSLVLSAVSIAVPIAAVSCGVIQNSPELERQNTTFSSENAAERIENLWVEKVLERLFSVNNSSLDSEIDNSESQFFKNAYQAFMSYSQFQLAKDELFFLKQISEWSTAGIFNADQTTSINQLKAINTAPTLEQFKILYKVKASKVAEEVNKLLLIEKYFKIDNESDLQKIFTDFTVNKPNYDSKHYPLITYVLTKQPIQTWNYNSSNPVDLFSSRNKTVASVNDFQNLFIGTFEQAQAANSNLLFSANEVLESKLSGFKGLEIEKAQNFNLSFSVADLKQAKSNSLYGFFPNSTTRKLITVSSDNNTLQSAFPLYNTTSKQLSAVYVNQIAPIGKTVDTKDDNGNVTGQNVVLSFDGTVYESNINKLIYILSLTDSTIYTTAKTAFTNLGYKLTTTDEVLKKTLEKSGLL